MNGYVSASEDSLSRTILESVVFSGGLRFSLLQRRLLEDHGINVSRATIYRHIAALVEQNVIVRHDCELLPNLLWIKSTQQLVKKLDQHFAKQPIEILNLPQLANESREFRANSLYQLDPIWNHIHIELAARFDEREWYGYNAHAWFAVGMSESERRLHETVASDGQRYHLLYGNDSVLDRYGLESLSIPGYRTSISSSRVFSPLTHAIWAGNSFVIEATFPAEIAQAFEHIFRTVKSIKRFNEKVLKDIFKIKGDFRLQVLNNPERAENVRNALKQFFQ